MVLIARTRTALVAAVVMACCSCRVSKADAERRAREKAEAAEKERQEEERVAKVKAEFAERDREREARLAVQYQPESPDASRAGTVMTVGTVLPNAHQCQPVGERVYGRMVACGASPEQLELHSATQLCNVYGHDKLELLLTHKRCPAFEAAFVRMLASK